MARNALAVAAVPLVHEGRAVPDARDSQGVRERVCAIDDTVREQIAQQAVAAAVRAGAHYAEARLTHTDVHHMGFGKPGTWYETRGVGVRVLIDGAWGFAGTSGTEGVDVEELARNAIVQAKTNARGQQQPAKLDQVTPAVGRWATPVKIDPFTVPIEEKLAALQYWLDYSVEVGYSLDVLSSWIAFVRQERTLATSEGTRCSQTVYESSGVMNVVRFNNINKEPPTIMPLHGLKPAAKGWELFLEADIPAQLRNIEKRFAERKQLPAKPVQIGRYTLVCDGETMAALLERTLGMATQLDRALGYESNASGTSFLNDPLGMLGTFNVGSPLVTVTANRSAPGQLATVKWDEEGVAPEDFTLVKAGVLVDYQTTREQATWLAPYYQKQGKPIRSRGCAAAENAGVLPLQQMPNLALAPAATDTSLEDLIAAVPNGILVRKGRTHADFQGRSGQLQGDLREIRDGRLGRPLTGGAVRYDSMNLWRGVTALGGPKTRAVLSSTPYPYVLFQAMVDRSQGSYPVKGEPPQRTSYSVEAVAATITNQTVFDIWRKA
jgi:TldD protein